MNNIRQSAGKNLELAWLAGFLDGDGSVTLDRHKMKNDRIIYNPRVSFTNTDFNIVNEVTRILTYHNIGYYVFEKKTPNTIAKQVSVKGFKRVRKLLPKVAIYLQGRKKLCAYYVCKFLISRSETGANKTYTDNEIEFFKKVKELHASNYPQRLYAKLREEITDEEIVRTVQRCAEFAEGQE